MGIILNGNKPSKIIYNGAKPSLYFNGSKIWPESSPTPVLPANTVRVRTSDGNAPRKSNSATYETATLVSGTTDVYDVYKSGTSFSGLLYESTNVIEVLGANTTGIKNMSQMFYSCTALVSVVLFDTSSVTSMNNMFYFCQKLTVLPLFNTSKVSNMSYAFKNCYKLESGALALYRQASTQSTPPGYHSQTFMNCGKNTTTGAAELAQIPSDWK